MQRDRCQTGGLANQWRRRAMPAAKGNICSLGVATRPTSRALQHIAELLQCQDGLRADTRIVHVSGLMRYEFAARQPATSRHRFERLVARALDELPAEFREKLDNVDVVIEWWPRPDQVRRTGRDPRDLVLGLYEGVPLTRRTRGYALVPPDRIVIFQGPIEMVGRTDVEIQGIVRRTVLHEIGHHFGLGDHELRELGY